MDILPLLIRLSGILALLALIWLSIRAFRKHAAWGFLVLLFSPVGATLFGIRHWAEVKKPFLAYTGTFTLFVSLALYLFTSWGGWELIQARYRVQQGLQNQDLSREDARAFIHSSLVFSEKAGLNPEDQQQLNAVRSRLAELEAAEQEQARLAREAEAARKAAEAAAEASAGEKVAIAGETQEAEPKKERYRLEYKHIPVAEAKHYVGSTVKVIRKGVQEKEYRLVGATAGRLKFAQRNSAGTYSFSYRTRDIEKIRVLTKQPY